MTHRAACGSMRDMNEPTTIAAMPPDESSPMRRTIVPIPPPPTLLPFVSTPPLLPVEVEEASAVDPRLAVGLAALADIEADCCKLMAELRSVGADVVTSHEALVNVVLQDRTIVSELRGKIKWLSRGQWAVVRTYDSLGDVTIKTGTAAEVVAKLMADPYNAKIVRDAIEIAKERAARATAMPFEPEPLDPVYSEADLQRAVREAHSVGSGAGAYSTAYLLLAVTAMLIARDAIFSGILPGVFWATAGGASLIGSAAFWATEPYRHLMRYSIASTALVALFLTMSAVFSVTPATPDLGGSIIAGLTTALLGMLAYAVSRPLPPPA